MKILIATIILTLVTPSVLHADDEYAYCDSTCTVDGYLRLPCTCRVEATGRAFDLVTIQPETWRDEDGLVWSDVSRDSMTQENAAAYCHSMGADLPTKKQYLKLWKYMGGQTPSGYHEAILPGLGLNLWTSTEFQTKRGEYTYYWEFSGSNGTMDFRSEVVHINAMCVSH